MVVIFNDNHAAVCLNVCWRFCCKHTNPMKRNRGSVQKGVSPRIMTFTV
jgi:hypothetical protein